MEIKKVRWLGKEGATFGRVCLAFRMYGLTPPYPDLPGGEGAYVLNVLSQYRELSEYQVLGIIEYGVTNKRVNLEYGIANKIKPINSLEDIGHAYYERYIFQESGNR